jgi:tetratricopeptide (TPR) repeat protein
MSNPRFHCRRLPVCAFVFLAAGVLPAAEAPSKNKYTIEGNLTPPRMGTVVVRGVGNTYLKRQPVYWDGKFKFKNLKPGSYNVAVVVYRMGEFRQTYNVGPSTSDEKGRVKITMVLSPSRASRLFTPRDRFTVSASRLSIPDKAHKEVMEAQKKVLKEDMEGAEEHLRKAVEIAPQYAGAWNTLGTLAYQKKDFEGAERHFREAIKQDKELFEPVVNLGGVLLNLGRGEEAIKVNQEAVTRRPKDALANAQLGLSYESMKNYDLAIKYLQEAKRLDPGHFTHPQLYLTQIYIGRGQRAAAARELEHFLRYHPDYPGAGKLREYIKKLQSGS